MSEELSRPRSDSSEGLGQLLAMRVMSTVWALVRSGPNYDGKHHEVEAAILAALDAAVAAERERCARLCEQWDATHPARLAAAIRAA